MSVCLTMIVKNEAHIIARALRSALPYVDSYCICDTGSTDDTLDIIRDEVRGHEGKLLSIPWDGFGAARTTSLQQACELADYSLVLDADEQLRVVGDIGPLTEPCYGIWAEMPTCRAKTHRIFKAANDWAYEGVIHEYPVSPMYWDSDVTLHHVSLESSFEGARSKNPTKYHDDAHVIGEALVRDPTNARMVFHLACAWRDALDDERAARHFLQRAEMGPGLNWEEIYLSYLEAGRALCRMGRLFEAEKALLEARRVWPERREACFVLGEMYTHMGRYLPPCGTACVETRNYEGIAA